MSVWEAILGVTNHDHGVAMRLALHADTRALGVLGEAVYRSPTLIDAYEHVARYSRLIHQGVTISLDVTPNDVIVRYALAGATPDQARGALAAGQLWAISMLALLPSRLFGVDLKPRAVSFFCPPPADIDLAKRVFGENLSFSATTSYIGFDRHQVEVLRRSEEERLLGYLDALAESDLSNLPAIGDILAVVAGELRRGLVGEVPTVQAIARALGMSSRTLQRRIAEAGSTFAGIVDEVRKARAEELLMDERLPIGEIAYILGYSEQAAFSRASQRWFGAAPSKLRDR